MNKIVLFLFTTSSIFCMEKPSGGIAKKRYKHYDKRMAFKLAVAAGIIPNESPSQDKMQMLVDIFSPHFPPYVLGEPVFREQTPPLEDTIPANPLDDKTEHVPVPFLFAPSADPQSSVIDIRKASDEIPRDPQLENEIEKEIVIESTSKKDYARKEKRKSEETFYSDDLWTYKITCPYQGCSYTKKSTEDGTHDARWAKSNVIACFYHHLNNHHTKWNPSQFTEYVETNIHSYQTKRTTPLEQRIFEITCPIQSCTYKKRNKTSPQCGIKRARRNVVDCLRAHIKKYHQTWTTSDIRKYADTKVIEKECA